MTTVDGKFTGASGEVHTPPPEVDISQIFPVEDFSEISKPTRAALQSYYNTLDATEVSDRAERLRRRYELIRIFVRRDIDIKPVVSPEIYDALFLGDIADDLNDETRVSNAAIALNQFVAACDQSGWSEDSDRRKIRKYRALGLLAGRVKISRFLTEQIAQQYSTDHTGENGEMDKQLRNFLSSREDHSVSEEFWLKSPKGVRPATVNELLMRKSNFESVIIAAVETLDLFGSYNASHEKAPATANNLRQAHLAEAILAPLVHTLRFKSLAQALRSESIKVRIRNGGRDDLRDQAVEILRSHGNHSVYARSASQLQEKLFEISDQELMVAYDKAHHIWSQYGVAKIRLNNGKTFDIRFNTRRKGMGQLEEKLLNQEKRNETGVPMDLMGIEIKVAHTDNIPAIAAQILWVIQTDRAFELKLSPSRELDETGAPNPIEKAVVIKGDYNLFEGTKGEFRKLNDQSDKPIINMKNITPDHKPGRISEIKFTASLKSAAVGAATGETKIDEMPWEIVVVSEDMHKKMELGEYSHVWSFKLGIEDLEESDLMAIAEMNARVTGMNDHKLYAYREMTSADAEAIDSARISGATDADIAEMIAAANYEVCYDTFYDALELEYKIQRLADRQNPSVYSAGGLAARMAGSLGEKEMSKDARSILALDLKLWKIKNGLVGSDGRVIQEPRPGHILQFIKDKESEAA